ncbi:hypothetical protein Pan258_05180 [Symmachiella dynata]|uniref:Uncharacterized protein n=1 Tax=Symmachiella dynata TaxID=2527995 RepID=A0A517ZHP7_9PLAN|nr:hypothetical protein [Symmachiella dynata]QDT46499.1 hypothetical protein Pan258_05180 [Symmachiella dynata]QDU42004.1 hypothetical protein Mal52_04590 [Symmachiella dynata]
MDKQIAFGLINTAVAIVLMRNIYRTISWLRTGVITKTSDMRLLFKKDEGDVIDKSDSPGRYWEVIAIDVILQVLMCTFFYYVALRQSVF